MEWEERLEGCIDVHLLHFTDQCDKADVSLGLVNSCRNFFEKETEVGLMIVALKQVAIQKRNLVRFELGPYDTRCLK